MRHTLSLLLVSFVAGCSSPQPAADTPEANKQTLAVAAKAETRPVATLDDAADDPAIWRNAADPAKSLVIGTDKRAGIHVYDLAGKQVSFTPSARLNNVDLRAEVTLGGQKAVLVAASDRADDANAKMALFRLDTVAGKLLPLVTLPVGKGEAYGMCLWQRTSDAALFAFVVLKDGRIDQLALDLSGAVPTAKLVRSMKLATQSEGCVADDRTGVLYVAEEDTGVWTFAADPAGDTTAKSFAKVDKKILFDDAEGLALAPAGDTGGYLVVSSQGDNAYSLYRLADASFAGRFAIKGGAIDGTSETDGIELLLGDFGPDYPAGLFVAQDGDNAPDAQNFKYASWADVVRVLALK
jgi:myo-inositol-hexaphosphate 3-phosphohydrolase